VNLWVHALEKTRQDQEAFALSGDPLQYGCNLSAQDRPGQSRFSGRSYAISI